MKTFTYHVFHIGCWGKHLPSYFVMVIKNGEHVVLADITLSPDFGRGVCPMALRCAEIGEIERGDGGDARCQCTCAARYAQEDQVYGKQLMLHVCGDAIPRVLGLT